MDKDQVVLVLVVSGAGPHLQNKVGTGTDQSGTGTDQSGTGTDASSSPDFCTLALLSPILVHQLFRDPNK